MDFQNVTVIIPYLNAEATIEQCATSLLKQTYLVEKTVLLFVDNGSTDQSTKKLSKLIAKENRAQIIYCSKPGSYSARNTGLKQADSEIIAFTDSDCIAHPRWLETLVSNYSSKKIGGVGGKLIPLWEKSKPDFYATYHWLVGVYEQSLRYAAGYIQTANASYRKDVLDRMQGYDESFVSGGDADLSWRVTNAGHKILYDPNAIIYHHPRRSVTALTRLFTRYGKGTAELEKTHPSRKMLTNVALFRTQFRRFRMMFTHPIFKPYRKYVLPAIGLEVIRALAFLAGYFSKKFAQKSRQP
ncbi:MAG: glycosyltransferase [Candidatus Heimdallarchaeota archaeon]